MPSDGTSLVGSAAIGRRGDEDIYEHDHDTADHDSDSHVVAVTDGGPPGLRQLAAAMRRHDGAIVVQIEAAGDDAAHAAMSDFLARVALCRNDVSPILTFAAKAVVTVDAAKCSPAAIDAMAHSLLEVTEAHGARASLPPKATAYSRLEPGVRLILRAFPSSDAEVEGVAEHMMWLDTALDDAALGAVALDPGIRWRDVVAIRSGICDGSAIGVAGERAAVMMGAFNRWMFATDFLDDSSGWTQAQELLRRLAPHVDYAYAERGQRRDLILFPSRRHNDTSVPVPSTAAPLLDRLIIDAFPMQVLSSAHVAALKDVRDLRMLPNGGALVLIADDNLWRRNEAKARKDGRRLLAPLIKTEREVVALRRRS